MFALLLFSLNCLNAVQGFLFYSDIYFRRMFMTESDLQELNWIQVEWNKFVYQNNKMLLWLPFGHDETIITSLNNYSNVYFKGIIDTKEEIEFITNILTKTEKL